MRRPTFRGVNLNGPGIGPRPGLESGKNQRDSDDQVGRPQQTVSIPPSYVGQKGRQRADYHQLPGGVARHRHAVGNSPPPLEPPGDHHPHDRVARRGVPHGEQHAVDQEHLPRLDHPAHQPYAHRDRRRPECQHPPQAVPVHQSSGHRQGQCRRKHEEGHGEGEGRPAPTEVLGHWLEHQPQSVPRTAAKEQDEEPSGEYHPIDSESGQGPLLDLRIAGLPRALAGKAIAALYHTYGMQDAASLAFRR